MSQLVRAPALGAWGYGGSYGSGTIGERLQVASRNLFEFLTPAQKADVRARTKLVDVSAAVLTAVAELESKGGGTLEAPWGAYRLEQPVGWTTAPIELVGAGMMGATEFVGAHTAGHVLGVGYIGSAVRRITVSATSARKAAAAGLNVGIRDMAPDVAGQQVNGPIYDQVYILDQPSHGLAFISHWKGANVIRCRFADIGGHGIYADDGVAGYARVNNSRVGSLRIQDSNIFRCTGHSIAIGSPGAAGYRIVIDNVDTFHCALAAGVRLSQHNMWINAENADIRHCGIGGWSGPDGGRTLAVGGIYVNGRNAEVKNNRFIDVLGNAVTLGPDSDGADIDLMQVTGEVIVPLNPAVVVDAGATYVTVNSRFSANIALAMTPAPANSGNVSRQIGLSPIAHRSANQEIAIADDAATSFAFSAITRGVLILNGNSSTAKSVIVAFRVGDASAYCKLLSPAEANVVVGTGADPLTGTTGLDGDLTFRADTDSNTLYVENRRGFALSWMPTFTSLANGELVL